MDIMSTRGGFKMQITRPRSRFLDQPEGGVSLGICISKNISNDSDVALYINPDLLFSEHYAGSKKTN